MITPGRRGRHIWLVQTVEFWLAKYDRLMSERPDEKRNALAREATLAAIEFDKRVKQKLFAKYRDMGNVPTREGREDERDHSAMVA